MSNQQRPLNSSYKKAIAEQAAQRERQRIFVAEHFRATTVYEPGQAGWVPSAGQKPVEQPKSIKPGMSPDVDDGLKA